MGNQGLNLKFWVVVFAMICLLASVDISEGNPKSAGKYWRDMTKKRESKLESGLKKIGYGIMTIVGLKREKDWVEKGLDFVLQNE